MSVYPHRYIYNSWHSAFTQLSIFSNVWKKVHRKDRRKEERRLLGTHKLVQVYRKICLWPFLKKEELIRNTVRKTEIEDFQVLTLSNYEFLGAFKWQRNRVSWLCGRDNIVTLHDFQSSGPDEWYSMAQRKSRIDSGISANNHGKWEHCHKIGKHLIFIKRHWTGHQLQKLLMFMRSMSMLVKTGLLNRWFVST